MPGKWVLGVLLPGTRAQQTQYETTMMARWITDPLPTFGQEAGFDVAG